MHDPGRNSGSHASHGSHPADRLMRVEAVRERCGQIMAAAERGATEYFAWHPERLADAADYVAQVIRERHPDLRVPYHSRWRHFEAGGVDRWARLSAGLDGAERVRACIDLVIPSVLLDAGAGAAWRYVDNAHGQSVPQTLTRSEGLGVASLELYCAGAFHNAATLERFETATLEAAFQVRPDNPLIGVEGRAHLLRRLGAVASATPEVFGAPARLGNLYDYLTRHAVGGTISASFLVATLLHALGPVWPSRIVLDGRALGDCWRHPAATGAGPDDPTTGLVPFHKLTQWLAYSLLEPIGAAGLGITGLEALTGLPEYRNGGLLIDLGVLRPLHADLRTRPLQVDDVAVVEWRALTVIALDRLAAAVRARLGVSEAGFPLARVLEGGTWAAGRRIAAELRPGGAPPLNIVSDGTVF